MKILFICGSLEPGKDGVGDYSRRLCGELIRQCHEVRIIACNDKHIQDIVTENQVCDDQSIAVLRIGSDVARKKRIIEAKKYVEEFNPDWLSLQFVPFAFQNKGIPFFLANELVQIAEGRKWHIMFHELWVGISRISPLKHKILGYFQQIIAQDIVNKLKPNLISTTNKLYQAVLKKANLDGELIPLFSNIPKVKPDIQFKMEIMKLLSISDFTELSEWSFVGIFGSIYPQANLEKELNKITENRNLKEIAFISIGRAGSEGENELKRLKELFQQQIKFLILGEQSPERVSTLLQMLSFGISCTPSQHIGKSGVFAAMKLHGLDVVMSCGDKIPEYDEIIHSSYNEFINRPAKMWGVEYIATMFIGKLND